MKSTFHPARQFFRRADGSMAVEFALIFPIALVFFCGMLAYGIYFAAAHAVQQIAADAARASVGGVSDGEREAIVRAHVAASGHTYAFLRGDRIAVAARPLAADPTQFEVRVAFNSEDLPIWVLSGLVPMPGKTIERVAIIKRGGY